MERGVTSLTYQGEATANCTATVSGEAGLCGLFAGPKALNALGALKGRSCPLTPERLCWRAWRLRLGLMPWVEAPKFSVL